MRFFFFVVEVVSFSGDGISFVVDFCSDPARRCLRRHPTGDAAQIQRKAVNYSSQTLTGSIPLTWTHMTSLHKSGRSNEPF